jgi:hypothetical protein
MGNFVARIPLCDIQLTPGNVLIDAYDTHHRNEAQGKRKARMFYKSFGISR